MEKKPRAHAELIKQWAEGAEIQYRQPRTGQWIDSPEPAWVFDWDYRVKPAREYPKLAAADVSKIAEYFCLQVGTIELVSQSVFRHALDNGQVVTREEFKRVSDEANKAVRSLNAYGYTDEGGDMWKPPLGDRWPRDRLIAEHVAIAVETETRNAMQAGRTCKYSLDEIIARANK